MVLYLTHLGSAVTVSKIPLQGKPHGSNLTVILSRTHVLASSLSLWQPTRSRYCSWTLHERAIHIILSRTHVLTRSLSLWQPRRRQALLLDTPRASHSTNSPTSYGLQQLSTLNQHGHPLSYGFTSIVTVVLIGIRKLPHSNDPLDNGRHCSTSWHKTSKQH